MGAQLSPLQCCLTEVLMPRTEFWLVEIHVTSQCGSELEGCNRIPTLRLEPAKQFCCLVPMGLSCKIIWLSGEFNIRLKVKR